MVGQHCWGSQAVPGGLWEGLVTSLSTQRHPTPWQICVTLEPGVMPQGYPAQG